VYCASVWCVHTHPQVDVCGVDVCGEDVCGVDVCGASTSGVYAVAVGFKAATHTPTHLNKRVVYP